MLQLIPPNSLPRKKTIQTFVCTVNLTRSLSLKASDISTTSVESVERSTVDVRGYQSKRKTNNESVKNNWLTLTDTKMNATISAFYLFLVQHILTIRCILYSVSIQLGYWSGNVLELGVLRVFWESLCLPSWFPMYFPHTLCTYHVTTWKWLMIRIPPQTKYFGTYRKIMTIIE